MTKKWIIIGLLFVQAILAGVLFYSKIINVTSLGIILAGTVIFLAANIMEIKKVKAAESKKLIEKGEELYNHKELSNALRSFEKASKINPDSYEAILGIAQCHRMKMDYSEAVTSYQKATQIDPNRHEAYFFLAMVHLQHSRHKDALESFHQVEKIKKNEIEDVCYLIGDLYEKMGQFEEALEYFQRYLDHCTECKMRDGIIDRVDRLSHKLDTISDLTGVQKDKSSITAEPVNAEFAGKPADESHSQNEAPADERVEKEKDEGEPLDEQQGNTGDEAELVNGLRIKRNSSGGVTRVVDGIKVKVADKFGESIFDRDGSSAEDCSSHRKKEEEDKSSKKSPMGAKATARLMGMAKKRKPQMLNLEVQIGVKKRRKYEKPSVKASNINEADRKVMLDLSQGDGDLEKVQELLEKRKQEKETNSMDSGVLNEVEKALESKRQRPFVKAD